MINTYYRTQYAVCNFFCGVPNNDSCCKTTCIAMTVLTAPSGFVLLAVGLDGSLPCLITGAVIIGAMAFWIGLSIIRSCYYPGGAFHDEDWGGYNREKMRLILPQPEVTIV